jgi:hypothetical protein
VHLHCVYFTIADNMNKLFKNVILWCCVIGIIAAMQSLFLLLSREIQWGEHLLLFIGWLSCILYDNLYKPYKDE